MDVLLSALMIARDEEARLPACLASLRGVADEIIVTDTGSQDRTVEIAKNAGAQTLFFPWNNNEAEARNAGLHAARGRWVLWVDADEALSAHLASHLRPQLETLDNDPSAGAATLVLRNWFTSGAHRCARTLRLARRYKDLHFAGEVHPTLNARGKVVALDGILDHYGYLWTPEQRLRKGAAMRQRLEPLCASPDAPLRRLAQWLTALVIADDPAAVALCWQRIAALPRQDRLSGPDAPDWHLNAPNALEFWARKHDFVTGRSLARELALAPARHVAAWRYTMQGALAEKAWDEVRVLGEHGMQSLPRHGVEGDIVDADAEKDCARSCLALACAHTGTLDRAAALFPVPCPFLWLHHFVALTGMGFSRADDPAPLRALARIAARSEPAPASQNNTARIRSLMIDHESAPSIHLLACLTLAKMEALAGNQAAALSMLNSALAAHPHHPWVRGSAALAAKGMPLSEALHWPNVLAEL